MKYYHIIPSIISGYAIISEASDKYYSYPEGKFPKGDLVMIIDSYDWHKHLFTEGSSSFFVTSSFKKLFEEQGFSEISFKAIDKLIIDLNLEDNYPEHNFTKDSFWKLNIREGANDFTVWKKHLVVSEKALKFLVKNDAFQDFDEGIGLGPEYSMITNRFLIEGNIEDFFLNEKPKINEEIKQKRKLHAAERKRRSSL